jgi:low affinity Fe/Cu permease
MVPTQHGGEPHDPGESSKPHGIFRKFAGHVASAVGSPVAFIVAVIAIIIWACLGPHYKYNDTWQLVINTGTTIITFLMVFLIQNTQNRDAKAIHLKLDELIRAMKGARNNLVDLEELSDEELNRLQHEFQRVQQRELHKTNGATHKDHAPTH